MINYEIVTSKGCSKCMMVKNVLKQNQMSYKEQNYNTMSRYKADKYVEEAKKIGCMGLPIILRNDQVIDIPGFLKYIKEDSNENNNTSNRQI